MTKTPKAESFEKSLESLEELVRELEAGDKGLDESLALFEKGVVLAKELSKRLEDAKTKVESLSKEGGKLVKKPFATED
ncbi:MAG: exodeoxyribonuclease VII small subunit [Elusimicrobia bacterium CG11_big_fil_rev_8_21_14_0_20_64_6]|nr:MAG: exodeoxyribonuclease VII small subunit [Elusimicrobia bacterium CG11_big_fil_rev_8_21_14_0_20_64_6]